MASIADRFEALQLGPVRVFADAGKRADPGGGQKVRMGARSIVIR